jgi:SAM-dependent methyltransferase
MPTSAAGSARESHQARELAESFGTDAERYDRTRPSYPAAMISHVIAAAPGPALVDVGCGTGIAARQFRSAGATVLGVEIDERMAEVARRDGFAVEVSSFESWDPEGRVFDAVTAGQTWHWVDPAAGAVKAAQALRPGGLIALFWNIAIAPAGLGAAFGDVYRRVVPGYPVFDAAKQSGGYSVFTDNATAGLRAANAFGAAEETTFAWERFYTKDEYLDAVPTSGGHSRFPRETLTELLAGLGAAIDAEGGGFTMDYTTLLLTAVRTG